METKKKFFYGWVVVGACFLIAMFPMVFISNTFSYYQVPICSELGISYVTFNVSNICSTVAGMIFSFFVAGKLAKGNTRLYILVGGIVAAAAYFAQSYITAVWQIYVTFFIANFAFSAMTYVPINFLISNWFIDRKGLATSIAFIGANLGGVIFSKLIAGMIASSGWRFSFRVTAVVTIVTAVVAFLLIRKSPADMGQEPYRIARKDGAGQSSSAPVWPGVTKKAAVKTSAFWMLALAMICCGMLAAGIMTQVPTFLIENSIDYAAVMVVFSASGIVSKLIMGPMFDKLGILPGMGITAAMTILALILLMLAPVNAVFAYIAGGVFALGLVVGTLSPPLLAGRLFGTLEFGAIYGLANVFYMAGCMIGPMLSSAVRTATGSYSAAWIAYMAVCVILFISAALAMKAGKKIREA